ncbi:formate--tetrahydrofolate ligase [Bombilactobacillus thymidiniphilus]|uniref:Formate--tetrahydrofolate ligase n=1 Tax=Bombilactobacillus thymidiniphilus TaxID=2923363 RepID=A0ABY4PDK3_9LACO|nr:formate--tetrahydrofolate ligase [Bombilactobacillus thymidiniphilus]UQS83574.1 formate--tetrahydrofolate ligase [Bombilactobacillus thymidiniphilus]
MGTDIAIAQSNKMLPITQIGQKLGLSADDLELYGNYKAKLSTNALAKNASKPLGKLVLITAMNPTPAGEGKSTIMIGLADALQKIGQKSMVAMREPSLGPVMGIKGGAAGGGYAQVVPMEDINLHFTGDMHALTAAINTLAALIDSHLQHGNQLQIDPRTITWQRALDVNDRALRNTVIGMGGATSGVVREEHFQITVASEMMAVLCLAKDRSDLKQRISNVLIGYTFNKQPVFVRDLRAQGALTLLLKDAIKPNLVQTLEHTPVLIHGGPFANIAHGCNSIIATDAALHLSDYVLTEAGFGADLGAEKFLDIVTPKLAKKPDASVLVATIRSLKYNGGQTLDHTQEEDLTALRAGFANLQRHILNLQKFGLPVLVAINQFAGDTPAEIDLLQKLCSQLDVKAYPVTVYQDGSLGATELAQALVDLPDTAQYHRMYSDQEDISTKINKVAREIYGAKSVAFSKKALRQIKQIEQQQWSDLPICIAKTQYSFSDDPKLLGAPTDFVLNVQEVNANLGAGFLVILTNNVLTMPGLPSQPAALKMDIAADDTITGLF